MKTKLIKIGNSRGIRLPKALIDDTKREKEVELILSDNGIFIKSVNNIRDG